MAVTEQYTQQWMEKVLALMGEQATAMKMLAEGQQQLVMILRAIQDEPPDSPVVEALHAVGAALWPEDSEPPPRKPRRKRR